MKKPTHDILVVDDNASIRTLLEQFCIHNDLTCHSAANAKEAYYCFDTFVYKYILLDIKLNGDNGVDVCVRMRKTEAEKKQTRSKIFAVTGLSTLVHRADLAIAGFDDIFEKPFGYKELLRRITSD